MAAGQSISGFTGGSAADTGGSGTVTRGVGAAGLGRRTTCVVDGGCVGKLGASIGAGAGGSNKRTLIAGIRGSVRPGKGESTHHRRNSSRCASRASTKASSAELRQR